MYLLCFVKYRVFDDSGKNPCLQQSGKRCISSEIIRYEIGEEKDENWRG